MDTNFIPLGGRWVGEIPDNVFPKYKKKPIIHASVKRGPKVIGETPEERKAIAKEVRKASLIEKRHAKSEGKRQRKINDILNRRMQKNPEKYSKNKDRNKLRELTHERHMIQAKAVKQHEELAAIHDPSGKLFNVGPVKKTEDGKVVPESEVKWGDFSDPTQWSPERVEEMRRLGFNPAALSRKMSHKQRQRLRKYLPKPIAAKPTRPEGISVAEGEEDWLALWDITDDELWSRIVQERSARGKSRSMVNRKKKEEGEFRRAMKSMKKQALSKCKEWDPEAAKRKILGLDQEVDSKKEPSKGGEVDSGGDDCDTSLERISLSGSGADSLKDLPANAASNTPDILSVLERALDAAESEQQKEKNKDVKSAAEPKAGGHSQEKRSKKRSSPDSEEAHRAIKKSKKSKHEANLGSDDAQKQGTDEQEAVQEPNQESKRSKKEAKRQAKEVREAKFSENESSKKRKLEKEIDDAEPDAKRLQHDDSEVRELGKAEMKQKKKAEKVDKATQEERWHADELEGDSARKDKFLKLLGAKKGEAKGKDKKTDKKEKHGEKEKNKNGHSKTVQRDLEKQFEAGMKQKHQSGGKKGLGAYKMA